MIAAAALSLLALAGTAVAPLAGPQAAHVLVVAGIGGETFYRERFAGWAGAMSRIATEGLGLPPEAVTVLAETPAEAGTSRKEDVLAAIAGLAERSRPGDAVMILLLGHGTARDERLRFNLPGPDLSPAELERALAPLADRRVAVVNAAPASGPFGEALAGAANRIVVTATASAAEDQETLFGGHFVDALAAAAADADKDGRVSLAEAFAHADREVGRAYEGERRVRTEHARLLEGAEGLARAFHLAAGGTAGVGERLDLELAARRLVEQVETLRRAKPSLEPADYQTRLEGLFVEIAHNRRAWRKAGQ